VIERGIAIGNVSFIGWANHVSAPQTAAEVAAMHRSLDRGVPFGGEAWTKRAIRRINLQCTARPQGRPK
jgi:putative transposase